jgi:hypothetical protein
MPMNDQPVSMELHSLHLRNICRRWLRQELDANPFQPRFFASQSDATAVRLLVAPPAVRDGALYWAID